MRVRTVVEGRCRLSMFQCRWLIPMIRQQVQVSSAWYSVCTVVVVKSVLAGLELLS